MEVKAARGLRESRQQAAPPPWERADSTIASTLLGTLTNDASIRNLLTHALSV
jgi:hypothetical protein